MRDWKKEECVCSFERLASKGVFMDMLIFLLKIAREGHACTTQQTIHTRCDYNGIVILVSRETDICEFKTQIQNTNKREYL